MKRTWKKTQKGTALSVAYLCQRLDIENDDILALTTEN